MVKVHQRVCVAESIVEILCVESSLEDLWLLGVHHKGSVVVKVHQESLCCEHSEGTFTVIRGSVAKEICVVAP